MNSLSACHAALSSSILLHLLCKNHTGHQLFSFLSVALCIIFDVQCRLLTLTHIQIRFLQHNDGIFSQRLPHDYICMCDG